MRLLVDESQIRDMSARIVDLLLPEPDPVNVWVGRILAENEVIAEGDRWVCDCGECETTGLALVDRNFHGHFANKQMQVCRPFLIGRRKAKP